MFGQYLKEYGLAALTSFLVTFGGCLGGCSIGLQGGGELSIGMRNDNFLVLRHTVDGDKQGKESKSEVKVDPFVQSLLGVGGVTDEAEATVIVPLTGE